jgi:hypothetical protein
METETKLEVETQPTESTAEVKVDSKLSCKGESVEVDPELEQKIIKQVEVSFRWAIHFVRFAEIS